jgi:hypothetical protein
MFIVFFHVLCVFLVLVFFILHVCVCRLLVFLYFDVCTSVFKLQTLVGSVKNACFNSYLSFEIYMNINTPEALLTNAAGSIRRAMET